MKCTACGHPLSKHQHLGVCPEVCPWCAPVFIHECHHAPREYDSTFNPLLEAVGLEVINDRSERVTRWSRRALWLFAVLHAAMSAYAGRDAGVSYLLGFLCAWFTYRLKDFMLERIAAREAKNKSKVIT